MMKETKKTAVMRIGADLRVASTQASAPEGKTDIPLVHVCECGFSAKSEFGLKAHARSHKATV